MSYPVRLSPDFQNIGRRVKKKKKKFYIKSHNHRVCLYITICSPRVNAKKMSTVVLAGLNSIQALQDKSRELSSECLTQTTGPTQPIISCTDISLASPSRDFLKSVPTLSIWQLLSLYTVYIYIYIFLVFVS